MDWTFKATRIHGCNKIFIYALLKTLTVEILEDVSIYLL